MAKPKRHSPPPPPQDPLSLRERVRKRWEETRQLWERNAFDDMTRAQRMLVRYVQIFVLVFRIEVYDRLKLHAQALTFATLLAFVPLLAVMFAIFRGFGAVDKVQAQVRELVISNVSGSAELQDAIAGYIEAFVANIQSGKLSMVSVVILIASVLSLLAHIEASFNQIFGVQSQRALATRFLRYWALLTLGPLILAASLTLSAAFQFGDWMGDLGWFVETLLKLTPLLITCVGFSLTYLAIPNTRVRLSSAIYAGLMAGTLWTVARSLYGWYVRNNVTVQDIYGSLAAIPLFVLWLYVSWLLVLFGAQLAYAFQNADAYRHHDGDGDALTFSDRERILVRLVAEISRRFSVGGLPMDALGYAEHLRLPLHAVESATEVLRRGGFVESREDGGLLPNRAPASVTVLEIVNFLRRDGSAAAGIQELEPAPMDDLFTKLEQQKEQILGGTTLQDLAARDTMQTTIEQTKL